MKIAYMVALLIIVLMVGCATTQTETPAEAPVTSEVPTAQETSAAPVAPAEEAQEEETVAVDADIKILNKAFDPVELTVSSGSTVTWINMDDVAVHSLSIIGQGVICPRRQTGEVCDYTFDEPGTYTVMDLVNKFRGTITVTGGEESAEETQ